MIIILKDSSGFGITTERGGDSLFEHESVLLLRISTLIYGQLRYWKISTSSTDITPSIHEFVKFVEFITLEDKLGLEFACVISFEFLLCFLIFSSDEDITPT